MNRFSPALAVAIVLASSAVALATGTVVTQSHRAFSVRGLHLQRGETVRFDNADAFLHQLYVESNTFKFASKEQAPGEAVDINFAVTGTFEVRCEIHPKMLLTVTVD